MPRRSATRLSDLHRHLDGSLRPSTLEELARAQGISLPEEIRFHQGMALDDALERFAITLSVLQDPRAIKRVASEICEDAATEGVTTLEIRFAPQLHRDAPMAQIVDAALDGIGDRAGLILCALFGEPPELVDTLIGLAAPRPGVVAIDLAGSPQSSHRWSMGDYAGAFDRARSLGIGRTVHAGEGRPPDEIRTAIEQLHAQRIGHGTSLLEDDTVVELVLERQVVIEACPTSNAHTRAVDDVSVHPLPRWLERGVRACINTDNTLFSEVDAPTEHSRAAKIPGMTADGLDACVRTGHAAAFPRK